MSQKRALAVLAFLGAVTALAWMGAPVPAKATPAAQALVSAQPAAFHTALLKTAGGEELSFPVLTLTHAIISPRDSASGLPTGKRQHKPMVLTKSIDKVSPLLLEAAIKGEPFTVEVTTYVRTGGRRMPFVTMRLENAFVASIGPAADDRPTEEVAFYYNKIAFIYAPSGTTLEDSWSGEYP
jgi:type VI secretion system secreted protein Hcp